MFATMAVGLVMLSIQAAAQQRATGERQITFTKDIAPIVQRSCVACHRPGQSAPMSLVTYEDTRPWVRAIKTRVASREMPPWHIDRNVGIQKFKNDPSLSDDEIATVVSTNVLGRRPALAGGVTFDPDISEAKEDGKAMTTATFAKPGEYVLRARASDTKLSTAQDVEVTVSDPRSR